MKARAKDSPNPQQPRDMGHDSTLAMGGPLAGIRVIEVASVILGPLAAQYLADLGADVIKVEPPEGDITRSLGPQRDAGMAAVFLNCNRNKRSVVLDLRQARHRAALQSMVGQSDVLLHSIRSASAKDMGLSYDDISKVHPSVIYCHVTGFAEGGPYAGRPAYEDIIQAMCGLADLQSGVAGVPRYLPTAIADKVTGLHAAYAVVAALFHRERTGIGQRVTVPMFEVMTAFNSVEHLWGMTFEPPLGSGGYAMMAKAIRRPHKTSDGYVAFLPYTDAQWRHFFEAIGKSEMMADERFCSYGARQRFSKEIWAYVGEELTRRSTQEWLALFGDNKVPIAALATIDELTADPHLQQTEFWQAVESAQGSKMRIPRCPFGFDSSPPRLRRPPPTLGQHTSEVLQELGIEL